MTENHDSVFQLYVQTTANRADPDPMFSKHEHISKHAQWSPWQMEDADLFFKKRR